MAEGELDLLTNPISAKDTAGNLSTLNTEQFITLTSAYTLTSQTAAQKLFNSSTNGALTILANTSYFFECGFSLSSLSGTSGRYGFAFGGTATITQFWNAIAMKGTSLTVPPSSGSNLTDLTWNTAANTGISEGNTSTLGTAFIKGKVICTTAGTLIPQVSLGVAAAAIVAAGSYFRIWPIGSNTVTTSGPWS